MNISLKNIGRDRFTDWAVIVCAAFLIAIILALSGYWTYTGVADALSGDHISTITGPRAPLDANFLSRATKEYDTRAAEKKRLLTPGAIPRDPSL